jgi:hypothetical protein
MADQDIISTQIFQAKDLPFKSVTVYEDQAEVHRKLVLTLKQGLNRIQLEVIFRTNTRGGAKVLAKGAMLANILFLGEDFLPLRRGLLPPCKCYGML